MIAQAYDEKQMSALLSLDGGALREPLLNDLQRCQTLLDQTLSLDARDSTVILRKALHELRGIALTVGATTLARHCAKAEAFCDAGHLAEVLEQRAAIYIACDDLRARLKAFPDVAA